MKTLPALTLVCQYSDYEPKPGDMSFSHFIVKWEDDTARYHIFVHQDGQLFDKIHRNLKVTERNGRRLTHFQTHKALDTAAAKHAPIVAAIKALVTPEALRAAWEADKAEDQALKAHAQKERANKIRDALDHEAGRLQLEGKGQSAYHLRSIVLGLGDVEIIRLVSVCQRI